MTDNSLNNSRIAKNTFALVVRMLFMTAISLLTSRVMLDSLGEDNYGIYNVVGGVVAMFSIVSGPMSSAIQRFITFELGTGNKERLSRIFSTSINVQLLIAICIVVLCEIIGVWFLNAKMNIPEERVNAANFVLQCSLVTFIVNLINVPYNAVIIAHEKMDTFAYLSVLEALLKLGVVYLIYVSPFDRLKFFSALLLLIAVLMRVLYMIYCKHHFEEARYHFRVDKLLFKEIASFAGWNFFGSTAYMFNTQGVNMLINVFFGVKLNAARAIAAQIEGAVTQFVQSFTIAINPQITKSYAKNDKEYLYSLISRGSKFSYLIMYMFIVPIVLEADTILKIWLKEVPDQTVIFTRLVLFGTLATTMGSSMLTGILATGNIRRYQIAVTIIGCLVFPLTWISYAIGAPGYVTYIIYAIIYFCLNIVRLYSLKHLIGFPIKEYFIKVFSRLFIVSIISFIVPGVFIFIMDPSLLRLFLVCIVSCVWGGACSYFVGLDKHEQEFFLGKAIIIQNRIFKRG